MAPQVFLQNVLGQVDKVMTSLFILLICASGYWDLELLLVVLRKHFAESCSPSPLIVLLAPLPFIIIIIIYPASYIIILRPAPPRLPAPASPRPPGGEPCGDPGRR